MRRWAWLALALWACGAEEPGPPGLVDPDPAAHDQLRRNTDCAACHPRQAEELAASPMAYAAFSPVFTALERALNETFDGRLGPAGEGPAADFCVRCHAPSAVAREALGPAGSMRARLSHPSEDAIGCELCHRAVDTGPQGPVVVPGLVKRGPLVDPRPNPFHGQAPGADPLLGSAALCGSCHDVRVPDLWDVVAQERDASGRPFARLEDLFSEWAASPWADADHPRNPLRGQPGIGGLHAGREGAGEVVTCQDCHMSLYPARGFAEAVPAAAFAGVAPAHLDRKAHKLYPAGAAATGPGPLPTRRVSSHAFVGASHPLVPWPLDPHLALEAVRGGLPPAFFDEGDPALDAARAQAAIHSRTGLEAACADDRDAFGQPACMHQRRTALLQAAVTLAADEVPAQVHPDGELDVRLWVENVGAGHRVPSGMSQERETWVELTVLDQGRACTADADCADLREARRFFEDPLADCGPEGPPDPVYQGAMSVDFALRAERSGRCDGERRRCVVYRSGYLVDLDGDGRLHDEPLRDAIVSLDPETLAETCVAPGPDADLRGLGVAQGLVSFHNVMQRVAVDAEGQPVPEPQATRWLRPTAAPVVPQASDPPVLEQDPRARRSEFATQAARFEELRWQPAPHEHGRFGLKVGSLLRANRFFNGRSLAPFEPRLAHYRLRVPATAVGPLAVQARVRFRFFPPRSLRALAAREAQIAAEEGGAPLVSEEMIDRGLLIVDLARAQATVEVLR